MVTCASWEFASEVGGGEWWSIWVPTRVGTQPCPALLWLEGRKASSWQMLHLGLVSFVFACSQLSFLQITTFLLSARVSLKGLHSRRLVSCCDTCKRCVRVDIFQQGRPLGSMLLHFLRSPVIIPQFVLFVSKDFCRCCAPVPRRSRVNVNLPARPWLTSVSSNCCLCLLPSPSPRF